MSPTLFSVWVLTAPPDDHHQAEAGGRGGRRSTLSCARARRSGPTAGASARTGEGWSCAQTPGVTRSLLILCEGHLRPEPADGRVDCSVPQNEVLEHSVKALTDELQDVRAERDVFQQKAHRLNVEMNHVLGNDEIRLLDVDALCMENR